MDFLLMVDVSNLSDLDSLSGFSSGLSNGSSVCPKRGVCVVYSEVQKVRQL
jgi:hypothetical protein